MGYELKISKYRVINFIKLPLRIAPLPILFLLFSNIISGIMPMLTIFSTAGFIDTALAVFNEEKPFNSVYPWILAVVAIVAFNWIYNQINSFAQTRLLMKMGLAMNQHLIKKRYNLAYRHIENADTWDLIQRVSAGPDQKIINGFSQIINFVRIFIQILGFIIVLSSEVWWVAIITALLCIPLVILGYKSGKANYSVQKKTSSLKRKNDYISSVLSSREYVNERSLFLYSKSLINTWYTDFEKIRKTELKVNIKWLIRNRLLELLSSFIFFGIIGVLLYSALKGMITLGLLVALVNATYSLVGVISNSINSLIEQFTMSLEFINEFINFYNLEEISIVKKSAPVTVFETLEFRNVTFSYSGNEKVILENISFSIHKGQNFALVGANGSGKTTIVKLLIGLYTEYEGEILVNGNDIRTYTPEEKNGLLSVVFQDFAHYFVSIKDNINFGSGMRASEEEIEKVLEDVGLKELVNHTHHGMQTPLGKIKEDGIDLSGGEWQRIAMARSMISSAPVIILDEPTAALDPVYESEVYKEFEKINENKTTILISHRLASTRMADVILVLDNGHIIEQGSHDELLQHDSLYAEMFNSQKSWYVQ
jgi:ATP-binding cassette subfamily B protein